MNEEKRVILRSNYLVIIALMTVILISCTRVYAVSKKFAEEKNNRPETYMKIEKTDDIKTIYKETESNPENAYGDGTVYFTINDPNHEQNIYTDSIYAASKNVSSHGIYYYSVMQLNDNNKIIEKTAEGWKITIIGFDWSENKPEYRIFVQTDQYIYLATVNSSNNNTTIELKIDDTYFIPEVTLPFEQSDDNYDMVISFTDENGKDVTSIHIGHNVSIPQGKYHIEYSTQDVEGNSYQLYKLNCQLSKSSNKIVFTSNELSQLEVNDTSNRQFLIKSLCVYPESSYFNCYYSWYSYSGKYYTSKLNDMEYFCDLNLQDKENWSYLYAVRDIEPIDTITAIDIGDNLESRLNLEKNVYLQGDSCYVSDSGIYDQFNNRVNDIYDSSSNRKDDEAYLEFKSDQGDITKILTGSLNYFNINFPQNLSGTYEVSLKVDGLPESLNAVPAIVKIYDVNNPQTIIFKDKNLEKAIRDGLDKQTGDITNIDMLDLNYFYAENRNIRDLTGLEYAANLKTLELGNNAIQDITPLSQLPALISLSLDNNKISDISPLKKLVNLVSLDISNNSINNLEALSENTNIFYLDISNNKISNFLPIQNMKNLIFLIAEYSGLNDVGVIKNLTKLKDLSLGGATIENFSLIKNFTQLNSIDMVSAGNIDLQIVKDLNNLNTIRINNCTIQNPSALNNIKSLTTLWLDNTGTFDIANIKSLSGLKELGIWNNTLLNVQLLSEFTGLNSLRLYGCNIKDISFAENLKNLSMLILDNNEINDISPVKNLTSLKYLSLNNNLVTNIECLENLTNIISLYLSQNKISDLHPVEGLINLENLYINNNQIKDISPVSKLNHLYSFGAASNEIEDISPLLQVENLNELYIDGITKNNSIFESLGKMSNLELLSYMNGSVDDISFVNNLTKLKYLRLSNNKISDITPVSNLINISQIDLSNNEIKNIQPLVSLTDSGALQCVSNMQDNKTLAEDVFYQYGIQKEQPIVQGFNYIIKNDGAAVPYYFGYGENYINIVNNLIDISSTSEQMKDIQKIKSKGIVIYYQPQKNSSGSITSIGFKNKSIAIGLNKPYKLEYTILPSNAPNKNVTWSSSNESIAVVDGEGNVTGKAKGTAIVTVTAEDGGKTASCTVTVKLVEQVNLNKTKLSIKPGSKAVIKASIVPTDSVNKNIIWSSSDASIASIDAKGNIIGIKEGKTIITAKSEENEKISAQCEVTVEIPVTSIKLNTTKVSLSTSNTYNTITLKAAILPQNATNKNVIWASSDDSIAAVDKNGMVTGKTAGKAIITATSESGSKIAKCTVTVAPVTGMSLSRTKFDMNVGASTSLKVKILPSNAAIKTVVWSTGDEGKVVITPSGKIIAVEEGTATVTAVSNDNQNIIASCVINVKPVKNEVKVTDITLTNVKTGKINGIILAGKTGTVKAVLTGIGRIPPTNKNLLWTSSDASIITVDDNGKVTAKKAGKAVITAKAADKSGIEKSVEIEVVQPVTSITMERTVTLASGEAEEIQAFIYPIDTTVDGIKIEWISSDKKEQYIQLDGSTVIEKVEGISIVKANINAVMKGSATITLKITTKDGKYKSISCKVTVK